MSQFFQCPDCHALHAEPLSPAFVVSVLCMDCDLAREVAPATGAGQFALPAAA